MDFAARCQGGGHGEDDFRKAVCLMFDKLWQLATVTCSSGTRMAAWCLRIRDSVSEFSSGWAVQCVRALASAAKLLSVRQSLPSFQLDIAGAPPTRAADADEIHELREREREAGIAPDHEIDAFMKASVRRGKRHNIRTDYVLRLLGLEVHSDDRHSNAINGHGSRPSSGD